MTAVNCIPAPLHGQEFLASSHYKISHDERFIPASLKSTFHKDYVPPISNLKPGAALPPRPSEFMHRDVAKINTKISETCQAFPAKTSTHDDPRDKYSSLYKTNFKLDSDKRIDTFSTTHERYYKPNPIGSQSTLPNLGSRWMKSTFPQGDKEKADEPISNYRGSFLSHDISKHQPRRAPSQHWGCKTITGDAQSRFSTTHDSTFQGLWVNTAKSVPKHTSSSIPEGDKEKVTESTTTMRQSYQPSFQGYSPQDRMESYSKLHATNYKMTDGHGRFDKYLSTQAECYQPINNVFSAVVKRDRDRNASDIPEGDMDPFRSHKRVNSTVARSHHKPLDLKKASVHRVNGSQLRTVSKVQLGEKELESSFYETTCDSTFHPVSVEYNRVDSHPKSNVPLKYYGDEKVAPTTWSDFPSHDMARQHPHRVALENLRETHFMPPHGDQRFFSTTHDSHYTPKRVTKFNVDPGRLQRSSIPIGTMGKYIKGCHSGYD
nr:testis-expressed protein 45-like [Ciona intestinalis]|eukprot:XP_002120880.1 testis-expressed protein 45-like [Ciona intestinalis]